ncbi:MAG TPA: hypothetical protein GX503_06740, partial [Clostridiales bacterium]|nr:hypothetical protein [Clostridiales bacterium]
MKVLKGELIQDGVVVLRAEEQYTNQKDFFIALVSISDALNVGVPIWTMKEDKLLGRKKEVFFPLEGG